MIGRLLRVLTLGLYLRKRPARAAAARLRCRRIAAMRARVLARRTTAP